MGYGLLFDFPGKITSFQLYVISCICTMSNSSPMKGGVGEQRYILVVVPTAGYARNEFYRIPVGAVEKTDRDFLEKFHMTKAYSPKGKDLYNILWNLNTLDPNDEEEAKTIKEYLGEYRKIMEFDGTHTYNGIGKWIDYYRTEPIDHNGYTYVETYFFRV